MTGAPEVPPFDGSVNHISSVCRGYAWDQWVGLCEGSGGGAMRETTGLGDEVSPTPCKIV